MYKINKVITDNILGLRRRYTLATCDTQKEAKNIFDFINEFNIKRGLLVKGQGECYSCATLSDSKYAVYTVDKV